MKLENINYKSNNNIILLFILLIILLIVVLLKLKTRYYKDTFLISPTTTNYTLTDSQTNDKTKLYGSLFLDNQKEIIKNMTNPSIKYKKKRIDLNNYSDIVI